MKGLRRAVAILLTAAMIFNSNIAMAAETTRFQDAEKSIISIESVKGLK